MKQSVTILWFQRDLRVIDNPALAATADNESTIIPLYIYDDTAPPIQQIGGAEQWWLHHSLLSLQKNLETKYGTSLILRKGDPKKILSKLISETNATHLVWNRRYDPHSHARDESITNILEKKVTIKTFNGTLLFEPWEVMNQSNKPFQVFTPFYKVASQHIEPRPVESTPKTLQPYPNKISSDALDDWHLIPQKPNWAEKFHQYWQPGEKGAHKTLNTFLEKKIDAYATHRDFPHEDKVSRLSPYLQMGEISPHYVWHKAKHTTEPSKHLDKFLSELGWREFSYYILYHFPKMCDTNFNAKFNAFPWQKNAKHLKAWQKGKTGYPIVDAGMRQLWETGWMHNRVRLIVGSFLTKHLGIDWKEGAAWFRDTLVDADVANNTASWQWVAGSGVDAAPYFRIFNPILQSQKFDKNGHFIRKWVPELKDLPDKYIHAPWEAPKEQLDKANVVIGTTYPTPTVDQKEARDQALAAFYKL